KDAQQLLREPRAQHSHSREALRLGEREAVGRHAALAEAEHDELLSINWIALDRRVEKRAQLVARRDDRWNIRRPSHRKRKPAVAHRVRPERDLERSLRADHEKAAAGEVGREAEQVLRVGAPAVERENRRMRAVAGRLENRMNELHALESCTLRRILKRIALAKTKL